MPVYFTIEKITDEQTGQHIDAVVKKTFEDAVPGKPPAPEKSETWCTILDLDRLFDCCVKKWGSNWNLDKVLEAIRDTEIR